MGNKKDKVTFVKTKLHPRNLHREGYDFEALVRALPELKSYVQPNKYGNMSIDFFDAQAVKMLNTALLRRHYRVDCWDIPEGYLCPPIPGRADYVHYVADLLASYNKNTIPVGEQIMGLDIGVGANCIYPIIANRSYGWSMVGCDSDQQAIKSANKIIGGNPSFRNVISCRYQNNNEDTLRGIIQTNERYDFTICNPPFYDSPEAASKHAYRKHKNLTKKNKQLKFTRNFGGQPHELWCAGGELAFIQNMIEQSCHFADTCFLFTTLVSNEDHLDRIHAKLEAVNADQTHTMNMAQGQKKSRIVAWTFLNAKQRLDWTNKRWQ